MEIRCDAGVVVIEEVSGSDHKPLGLGRDGGNGVGVVECVEPQCAGVAPDFVGRVAAGGSGAEWVWDCGGAAFGAECGGDGKAGAR